MDLQKEERYYQPNQLHRVFAISSVLFLAALVAMFGDDYIRDWKGYQREFRRLEIEKTRAQLEQISVDQSLREALEARQRAAQDSLARRRQRVDELESLLATAEGDLLGANMNYFGTQAKLGAVRYQLELAQSQGENSRSEQEAFDKLTALTQTYKEKAEHWQMEAERYQDELADLRLGVKAAENELTTLLRDVRILERNLSMIDPEKMSRANRVARVVRDLPVLDFLAPSIKIKQIVVKDIRDNVNFAHVPKVDRCTSCHLSIDKRGFEDAEQPFTTHPNLELYLTSSSPHPVDEFGCTSCHNGRGRGTSFSSAGHMPADKQQAEAWQAAYGWEELHYWDQKMYPARYSEAGCLKCHAGEPTIKGADKATLGLTLIEKAACFGCHQLERYADWKRRGPNLANIADKLDRDFAFKWIRNPRSFRHNAWMPTFFGQTNSSDPKSVRRTTTEIHAIVNYLFSNSMPATFAASVRPGNAARGEQLVASLGCLGCHVVEPDPVIVETTLDRMYQRQGPNLIGLGTKVSARWLVNWLKDPTFYNPHSRMPDLRLSDREAADIATYLRSMRNPGFERMEVPLLNEEELSGIAFSWLSKQNTEEVADKQVAAMSLDERLNFVGGRSILHYGCFSCHNIPGFEDAKPIGTPLTFEGSKPVHNLDFGSVHEIPHTNYSWFEAKLANPRLFDRDKVKPYDEKLRMPNFYFTPTEVEALVTALMGLVDVDIGVTKLADQDVAARMIQKGRMIIKNYNCQGCHIIDGQGGQIASSIGDPALSPPNLNTEGAKVKPGWLFEFLNRPSTIRPNLTVRMPTFNLTDEQWNDVIDSFQYADGAPQTFADDLTVSTRSDNYRAGEFMASKEIGDCGKCHLMAGQEPTAARGDWAPDLALTKHRLRPAWVVRWLRDPQAIVAGTPMPQPYLLTKDDVSFDGAEEFFPRALIRMAGDDEALLAALRDYVYTIGD